MLAPASAVGVTDQRARFREIFCAATDAHGEQFEDHRPCDEALVRLGGEPEATGRPVDLGRARSRLTFALVPGLGWSCFEDFILPSELAAINHIEALGYQFTTIDVDPLSSSTHNASQIRDALLAMTDLQDGEKLVLIGYSKGVPDILETLVLYPEIVDRVAAVVSIAGAVGGCPLADGASDSLLDTFSQFARRRLSRRRRRGHRESQDVHTDGLVGAA